MISLAKPDKNVNRENHPNSVPVAIEPISVPAGNPSEDRSIPECSPHPMFHHFLALAVLRKQRACAEKILREIGGLQYFTLEGRMYTTSKEIARFYRVPMKSISHFRTASHIVVKDDIMKHSGTASSAGILDRLRKSGVRATVSNRGSVKIVTLLDDSGWVFKLNAARNALWDANAILAIGVLLSRSNRYIVPNAAKAYDLTSHSYYSDIARKLKNKFYGTEEQQEIQEPKTTSEGRNSGLVRIAASSDGESMDVNRTTAELIAQLVGTMLEETVEKTVKKMVDEGYLIKYDKKK